jgi:hypothetical protein
MLLFNNGKKSKFRVKVKKNISSTTKTGRHDIADILLKMALNTINQIKYI